MDIFRKHTHARARAHARMHARTQQQQWYKKEKIHDCWLKVKEWTQLAIITNIVLSFNLGGLKWAFHTDTVLIKRP